MTVTKEFSTQEIMQYAIVIIDKLGFQSTKTYNSTKNKVVAFLDDFDRSQSQIKAEYEVNVDMCDFYLSDVQERAEDVLQYFCNIEPKRMGSQEEMFRTIKEVATNYYSTPKEFGTICYMYQTFKSREKVINSKRELELAF